jgi:hypothetical protein
VLLTRSPLTHDPKVISPFDLHVLGTPPAFVLSQDQTLHQTPQRVSSLSLWLPRSSSEPRALIVKVPTPLPRRAPPAPLQCFRVYTSASLWSKPKSPRMSQLVAPPAFPFDSFRDPPPGPCSGDFSLAPQSVQSWSVWRQCHHGGLRSPDSAHYHREAGRGLRCITKNRGKLVTS